MCLGEYGTVVQLIDVGRAIVRFGDDTTRQVSLAVLVAEGTQVTPGDRVMVSIGMALEHDPQPRPPNGQRTSRLETTTEVTG